MMMQNTSGWRPVEFNVLVKQDEVQEKTAGGIILAADTMEREKHAQVRGTIIDVSPLAFNEDIWPVDMDRPKAGDRVTFARHAGTFMKGNDGEEYRVIKDKDVVLIEVKDV